MTVNCSDEYSFNCNRLSSVEKCDGLNLPCTKACHSTSPIIPKKIPTQNPSRNNGFISRLFDNVAIVRSTAHNTRRSNPTSRTHESGRHTVCGYCCKNVAILFNWPSQNAKTFLFLCTMTATFSHGSISNVISMSEAGTISKSPVRKINSGS